MPGDIEHPFLVRDEIKIDIGIDDRLLRFDRSGQQFAIGTNNTAVPLIDPLPVFWIELLEFVFIPYNLCFLFFEDQEFVVYRKKQSHKNKYGDY